MKLEDLEKMVKNIPSEIVMYHILPCVPIKPLFRFKLVCKEWRNLISSDPIFKAIQSRRCLTLPLPPGLIYFKDYDNKLTARSHYRFLSSIGRDLVGLPDPSLKYTDICFDNLLASSNGLLCTSYRQYFCVSNPITKEFVRVPNSCSLSNIAFAFEPFSCNPFFSLVGLMSVVGSGCYCCCVTFGFTVYSSEKGTWSVSNAILPIKRVGEILQVSRNTQSVFTGGKLFWKLDKRVIWLNLKEDSAGCVSVPDSHLRLTKGVIGGCNGELSYTMMSVEGVDIRVLKLNTKAKFEWVQKYYLKVGSIFDKDDIHYMMLEGLVDIRPFPYEGGDMVMFWAKEIHGKGEDIVVFYNMKSGSLQLIPNTGRGKFITYKASLVSLPSAPIASLAVPKIYFPVRR